MQNRDNQPTGGSDGQVTTAPLDTPNETEQPRVETAFITTEIAQSIENYRAIITLTTQIITVLVLANATIVGYALAQRTAGILAVGAIFPLGIIATTLINSRIVLPVAYTLVTLENKYGGRDGEWVGVTFISTLMSTRYVEEMLQISRLPDPAERIARIKKMRAPIVGTGKGIVRGFLTLIALGQIAIAFYLTTFEGWRFL